VNRDSIIRRIVVINYNVSVRNNIRGIRIRHWDSNALDFCTMMTTRGSINESGKSGKEKKKELERKANHFGNTREFFHVRAFEDIYPRAPISKVGRAKSYIAKSSNASSIETLDLVLPQEAKSDTRCFITRQLNDFDRNNNNNNKFKNRWSGVSSSLRKLRERGRT
jgi:hypothetical protein